MINKLFFCFAVLMAFSFSPKSSDEIYLAKSGSVKFDSNAPLELIKAESTKLNGALNISKKTFAFKLPVASFMGFNSELQKEHFNENYLETPRYPTTEFKGEIVSNVNFKEPGNYLAKVKGKFTIHGITKERLLEGKLTVKENGQVNINSTFKVHLADYKIKIPKLVFQKIAEDVEVNIDILLSKM